MSKKASVAAYSAYAQELLLFGMEWTAGSSDLYPKLHSLKDIVIESFLIYVVDARC